MNKKREIMEAAFALADLGLSVVLLGDAGTGRGKIPRFKSWGTKATSDEEILAEQFEQCPNANIGVLLGPAGGVIDLEFDDEEGKRTAHELFGDATITPTYKSKRSIHRLFRWHPALPNIQKTYVRGLECRLGGGNAQTQSVLPPSVHENGEQYRWLPGLSPFEVEIAEIPEHVLHEITSGIDPTVEVGSGRTPDEWRKIEEGLAEGGRNNGLAALVGRWLTRLTDDELDDSEHVGRLFFAAVGVNQRNTPPLSEDEVQRTFASILKRERQRRIERATSTAIRSDTESEVAAIASGTPEPAGFRLVIIKGEPAVFWLYSSRFQNKEGRLILSSAQIHSFSAVRTQGIEQAQVMLPKQLAKKWDSILESLLLSAETREPDPETHRPSIIAATILENAAGQSPVTEADARQYGVEGYHGVATLEDGNLAVSTTKLLAYIRGEGVLDKCNVAEVVAALRSMKGEERRGRRRWWYVPREGAHRLETMDSGQEMLGSECTQARLGDGQTTRRFDVVDGEVAEASNFDVF